ncbi:hypothetical protein RB608_03890 [Nocardioides sp. LHD-245]|uniref:hypothetical protein n=1 Tax=Nocardioides sp. LHD-245 TaxID=3051387 RepID=UPI0027E1DA13|nr:hypothetical protein [Nocardioides sp. LHD-245]
MISVATLIFAAPGVPAAHAGTDPGGYTYATSCNTTRHDVDWKAAVTIRCYVPAPYRTWERPVRAFIVCGTWEGDRNQRWYYGARVNGNGYASTAVCPNWWDNRISYGWTYS